MKNQPKEPPQIAVKFANIVFVLGILFSILIIVFAIYKIYNLLSHVSPVFYISLILSGGVFATLFGLGLKRLSNNLKVNLSLLFFITGITIYGIEIYLVLTPQKEIIIKQKQMDVPYDTRTKMEVLDDLNDSGVEIIIKPAAIEFAVTNGLNTKKGRIYPLGTISNSTTIFDNESGYYPIIEMDEHGFNNPKGLYNKNKVDIVLIGDSFAEGYSVHSNETIGAVLRQLDFNAISFGRAGNGPFAELATVKEYAEPLEPKIVLWLYYANDLHDIDYELQSPLLKKYLKENNYSQNLLSRQEEIDAALKNYIKHELKKERGKQDLLRILRLYTLRTKINLNPTVAVTPANIISIFRDILQKSKQMVSEWDGKMYFVYCPVFENYSIGNEHANRDVVIQTATELDIPIIDIHSQVFDRHPDPLSLFPFRLPGHYNAEGYQLIAEAIGKRLEADGYVPIKSNK